MLAVKSFFYSECVFLVLMLVFMLGQKFQLFPFKLAFGGFALTLLLSAVVAVLALIAFGLSFGPLSSAVRMHSLGGFALGIIPLIMLVAIVGAGFKVPKIHDISTDLEHNIAFEKAPALRAKSENGLEFPSAKVMEQHLAAYAHIRPLEVSEAPDEALIKAIKVSKVLGWQIHHQNSELRTFEATEATALFGFIDDIVIRVSVTAEGSKIDTRSVSRVGVSDLGVNAKRIERFQKAYSETD